jgi:uncharacterized protein
MLSEPDRKAVISCARRYRASSVVLFGSSLGRKKANDIDLGVKGVPPRLFFRFYADLIASLSKPVDLVDLSHKSLFNELVEEEGVKIYG